MVNESKEAKGRTVVHMAAARGDLDVFKYIVDDLQGDIKLLDDEKNPPLFIAI